MKILDAIYKKGDYDGFFKLLRPLDAKQKCELKSLLIRFEPLFDGSLRNWKTDPVDLQLKLG
jgi:predicted DNA-binding antitoxin AbrB/MazE fold protein